MLRAARVPLLVALALVLLLFPGGSPRAAEPEADEAAYPARPITVIVPWTPGGPGDALARFIASHMSLMLRREIVVENVVGSGGLTASLRVKQAAPDGYTLLVGNNGSQAAAAALYPKLGYDPSADFEPVGLVTRAPIVILGRRDFPAESLDAFVHYVQANSHKLDEGHEGVGSIPFVACLLLNHLLLAKPLLVPYEGTAPLMDAVARGRIDYVCDSTVNAAPQVRAGRVKAFGVAATERSAALPDVPTTKEGGLPTYELSVWYAIFAPKGVPKAVVEKINSALSKVLEDETVRRRMRDLGADIPDPGQRTPEALAELVRDEMNRWASLIKAERVNPK